MDINSVAPYMHCGHGYVICVECDDGLPLLTVEGDAVVLMRGMIHGTLEEMTRQADYAFAVASRHSSTVVAIVETRHKSFRFPDTLMREFLKKMRKYESKLQSVYFAGLSFLVRTGMKLFAIPLLHYEMQKKLRIVDMGHLGSLFGRDCALSEWGGRRKCTTDTFVYRRAAIDGVIPSTEERNFDESLLKKAEDALRNQLKLASIATIEQHHALCSVSGEKRGGGGWMGTTRWKKKHILVADEIVAYADTEDALRIDSKVIARQNITNVSTSDNCVNVVTEARPYLFRFKDADTARMIHELLDNVEHAD